MKMKNVCMPVVEVSQGNSIGIYWREIPCWCHDFSSPTGICTSECHETFSANISKNCINLESHWFL